MTHSVVAVQKIPLSHHYSNKNHSIAFKCPCCGKEQRRSLNFLGANVLLCDVNGKWIKHPRRDWLANHPEAGNV